MEDFVHQDNIGVLFLLFVFFFWMFLIENPSITPVPAKVTRCTTSSGVLQTKKAPVRSEFARLTIHIFSKNY